MQKINTFVCDWIKLPVGSDFPTPALQTQISLQYSFVPLLEDDISVFRHEELEVCMGAVTQPMVVSVCGEAVCHYLCLISGAPQPFSYVAVIIASTSTILP